MDPRADSKTTIAENARHAEQRSCSTLTARRGCAIRSGGSLLRRYVPPGQLHVQPLSCGPMPNPTVTSRLAQTLVYQRGLFQTLSGRGGLNFAHIDFKHPGDGRDPTEYGDGGADRRPQAAPIPWRICSCLKA